MNDDYVFGAHSPLLFLQILGLEDLNNRLDEVRDLVSARPSDKLFHLRVQFHILELF